jgi:hypothetical protein
MKDVDFIYLTRCCQESHSSLLQPVSTPSNALQRSTKTPTVLLEPFLPAPSLHQFSTSSASSSFKTSATESPAPLNPSEAVP